MTLGFNMRQKGESIITTEWQEHNTTHTLLDCRMRSSEQQMAHGYWSLSTGYFSGCSIRVKANNKGPTVHIGRHNNKCNNGSSRTVCIAASREMHHKLNTKSGLDMVSTWWVYAPFCMVSCTIYEPNNTHYSSRLKAKCVNTNKLLIFLAIKLSPALLGIEW